MPIKDYTRRPRTGTTVHLTTRFEDADNPGEYLYVPTFPTVFKDAHLAYVKAYDVFFSDYLEPERFDEDTEEWEGEPLLQWEHIGLYCDLYYAAERGERFSIGDLAERRRRDKESVRAMLDRLEDAMLIISVKDCEAQGHPTHIIVCSPFSSEELRSGKRAMLAERIRSKETLTAREESKTEKALAARRGRTKWPRVSWSVSTIRKAIMVQNLARDLHAITERVFRAISQLTKDGEPPTEGALFDEVKRLCKLAGLPFSRELYCTALTFQVNGLAVPEPPAIIREPKSRQKRTPERPPAAGCPLCDGVWRRVKSREFPQGAMKRCSHDAEAEATFPAA